ncbi:MAG: ChaN family lipoprotein [Planctomycetota bacterium]
MSRLRVLFLLVFVPACGSTESATEEERVRPPEVILRPGDLPAGELHRTSRGADAESAIEELARADVVYLGEFHTNADHHRIQYEIIRQLHARGRLEAIGMEMFQRPFQPVLDDFIAHRIDEATMLERTEWSKRWGYDFSLYKPILDFAHEHRIPIVALNVSTELRSVISKDGYDGLTDEQRARLPAPDTSFPGYRDRLIDVIKAHMPAEQRDQDPDPEMLARFERVQTLWDDVMADSVVQWMRSAPKGAQMAVIIGGGHVSDGWGVPARAKKRQGGQHATVVMTTEGMVKPANLSRDYADFVWVTPAPEETKKGS